jgi:hypothetical protein
MGKSEAGTFTGFSENGDPGGISKVTTAVPLGSFWKLTVSLVLHPPVGGIRDGSAVH